MQFIDSSYEIIEQAPGLMGVYKQIEKAARTAYKSEDKITDDSAPRMVEALCKSNHGACLEHGTIYLFKKEFDSKFINKYSRNKYSISKVIDIATNKDILGTYITTNARVIFENGWQDDLQYMCEPTKYHEKRYTVKFILSAGIGREFTRHRAFSFMQESTRFCNYSKGKFGEELTFVIPRWIYNCRDNWAPCTRWPDEKMDYLYEESGEELVKTLTTVDRTVSSYCDLLEKIENEYLFDVTEPDGYKLRPEEARGMLPLDIKSELVMTGFESDWVHFFNLRSHVAMTGKPHPDAQFLADGLLQEFIDRGYCTYEDITKTEENN